MPTLESTQYILQSVPKDQRLVYTKQRGREDTRENLYKILTFHFFDLSLRAKCTIKTCLPAEVCLITQMYLINGYKVKTNQ